MAARKQPRRIARELAILSLSQIKGGKLSDTELEQLILAAIRTLSGEINEILETAAGELQRGEERLLSSETRSSSVNSARTMIREAMELAQVAINRLGSAMELPEFLHISRNQEVQDYAIDLLSTIRNHKEDIQGIIEKALVDWQFSRLPKMDRDILCLAVAEITYLQVPHKVAINEAVELAKTYSDEDGHRFINGVLRRVVDLKKGADQG